jgi:hypothetical protein
MHNRAARGPVEGPNRLTQKRPRTFVSASRSVVAMEMPKNQLSRDFWCRSIFDFCNKICQTQKFSDRSARGAGAQGATLL